MTSRVLVRAGVLADIEARARGAFPRECCGLLEGIRGKELQVLAVHAAVNISAEADRFEIDPREQIRLMQRLRGTEREIVGCYHSHPNGRDEPSPRDLENAAEPGFIWLIAALDVDRPFGIRAFVFNGSAFDPLIIRETAEATALRI